MIGVFDGHGGKRCSKYAGQHMPENVMVALTELRSTGSGDRKENDNENIARALKLAYRYSTNVELHGDGTCA
jgi:serine/threonine protein phosphatase PrpC